MLTVWTSFTIFSVIVLALFAYDQWLIKKHRTKNPPPK